MFTFRKFLERLANLINVKTIVTFVVTYIFAVMALRGDIANETAMTVVIMVLGFYFGTQHEQNNPNNIQNPGGENGQGGAQNNGEFMYQPERRKRK